MQRAWLAGLHVSLHPRAKDAPKSPAPACRIALQLRNLGFGAVPIHGQMSQPKRIGALHKVKSGDRSILVATGKAPLLQPDWS